VPECLPISIMSESQENEAPENQSKFSDSSDDSDSDSSSSGSDSDSSSSDSSGDDKSSSGKLEVTPSSVPTAVLEPPSPVATTPVVDTSLGQEPVVVKSETGLGLDLSEDRNIESWGSLDEIQQFLTDSVPTSVPGLCPVDPVFVDHEDSQHATQMDSLVFESTHLDNKSLEDMNEPRLESVCNSTINSNENSIVMGEVEGDIEDGEINSPDEDEKMEQKPDVKDIKMDLEACPLECPKLIGLQEQEKKKSKKRKKDRKRKKEVDSSDDSDEDTVARVRKSIQKKPKKEVVSTNPSQCQDAKLSVIKDLHHGTNKFQNKSSIPKQNPVINPPLPGDETKNCRAETSNPPPPKNPAEKDNMQLVSSQTTTEGVKKCKKLSIKDYKAKKEAERLRLSGESESNYSSSSTPSKEASPIHQNTSEQPEIVCNDNEESINDASNNDSQDDKMEEMQNEGLLGFDILDEIEDGESDEDDISKDSEDESDSLAEDEVDQMLEANVANTNKKSQEEIVPQEKLKKLVLEERGGQEFEVLPLGWVSVTHNSGMPLYLHRESRVVTASKPYDLGHGSVRKHNIPISAIPCYAYKYLSPPNEPIEPAPPQSCPYSGASSFRENASPDSTTDTSDASKKSLKPAQVPISASISPTPSCSQSSDTSAHAQSVLHSSDPPDSNSSKVFPRAQISTIEETLKQSELTPEEVTNYCKKVFKFKELEVAKFKTWKERRAYFKQSHKKKVEKELMNRPTLPEGTKIITIPTLELSNIPGTEGESAINQKVVKKSKKKWVINPVGKSMVCLLHEYVQQSLKTQPYYNFTELDNAATPYAAVVKINDIEYGRGTGSSKKIAKSEAAKHTLEMLIPEIKEKLPNLNSLEGEAEAPDLAFFDGILVEDARVADLCNRTSEPAPYQILVTCLQRNYGLGDTHIHQEMKTVRNGKNEYTMIVNKKEVSVICKNKKDGKQLAAQKLLQQLHPHISSWGSLLRMYGNRSMRKLKMKKEKETEVTGLQTRSHQTSVPPSLAILDKLREEMKNLRESRQNIVPIGKFVVSLNVGPGTGLNTDHVDL